MEQAMCKPDDEEKMARLILKHTTTFGVRSHAVRRHTLERSTSVEETAWENIRVKTGGGYGVSKCKYEYEDLARLARERDLPLMKVKKMMNIQKNKK